MENLGKKFPPLDFYELDIKPPEDRTALMESITEWFKTINITDNSISWSLTKDVSSGVYSHGFRRYSKIDPRYRLIIYSSLIRQIYKHNSLTCLIFNSNTKNRLRELIRLGHGCLDDRNKKFLDFTNWFSESDIIYEFQMLSQTSSLFLESNVVDIFHHCSLMEKMQNHWDVWSTINGCFERSVATKSCVVMSSLDKDAQNIFLDMVNSIGNEVIQNTTKTDEIEKPLGVEWRDLQLNALLLKQKIEEIIEDIKPDTGKSVTKRLSNYKHSKENHTSLYKQLGIPTYIKSENKRGRRTEILYYHQNRNELKIEHEIKYLPESLYEVTELFHDSDCVVSAPYLIMITISHVLQFTQCINSLGYYSNKVIISEFVESIDNSISVISKWGFKSWPLSTISNLFKDDDGTDVLEEINRKKVIGIQNEFKDIYDKIISDCLCFPNLVPKELLMNI